MKNFIALLFLLVSTATFGATKIIQADAWWNNALTLQYLPPSGVSDTLVGQIANQTLTNKTLTSPVINSPTGIVKGDVGLGNVDNTSDATKNSATVVLTNKDIDGGTASNTSRITLPKAAKTTLDGLTRKQGTVVYDTTSNKPYYDDGTNLKVIGSGSGGAKNYIVGGDAESGTTGFATYADAAGTSPVDGTGGSPSVTFTTSSTSPLENTNSFLLTKDATNRQGDGASYAFTIDTQDRAKVLQISFNYLVSSGTFVAGTSSTASDVTVWIYDVTNAVIIQPSSISLLSNSTTIASQFNATFQTASNSSSYRLIFHVGSTSASAYTLKIDDIKTSPSTYVYGTPVTDFQSYTSSPVGFGTVSSATYEWARHGDSLFLKGRFQTGTTTAVAAQIPLPTGLVIDPVKVSVTRTAGQLNVQGSANEYTILITPSASYLNVGDATAKLSAANGTVIASTSTVAFEAGPIPIQGWSSSVQTSDQTDTRVVAARYTNTSAQSLATGSAAVITNWTLDFDTHAAMNATTGVYTVPVAGFYRISTNMTSSATALTTAASRYWQILLSGTNSCNFTTAAVWATQTAYLNSGGSVVRKYNVGDTISLTMDNGSGSTVALLNAAGNNWWSIERLTGPSAIAATESMNARYTNTAGTSIANSGSIKVPFATKDFDSHGAFVTDTFTCLIPGKFNVNAKINFASSTYAAGNLAYLQIFKNGSVYSYGPLVTIWAALAGIVGVGVNDDVNCLAGDTIDVRAVNNRTAGATLLDTLTGKNSISIKRVGN